MFFICENLKLLGENALKVQAKNCIKLVKILVSLD